MLTQAERKTIAAVLFMALIMTVVLFTLTASGVGEAFDLTVFDAQAVEIVCGSAGGGGC